MQERFRVRNGYIVTLTDEQVTDLLWDRSTLVDIDGTNVEIHVDGTERLYQEDADENLVVGFNGVERLSSGFPTQFYSVLHGEDVVLLANSRLTAEREMIRRAGGLLDPDPDKYPSELGEVEEDVDIEETAAAEEDGNGALIAPFE